jgi:hypothetical protein
VIQYTLSFPDAPKGSTWFSENPVLINLLEHPFFFGYKEGE